MLLGGPAELTHHTTSTAREPSHTHHTHQTSDKGMAPGSIQLRGFPSVWRAWCGARRLSGRARGAARAPRRALLLSDNQVVWFRVNRGRFPRSAKAQVLPERPRSSLYRRQRRPPFYTPLTVSATLAVTRTCPGKGAAVGSTVKMMKKMESGALAVHVEAGLSGGLLSILP